MTTIKLDIAIQETEYAAPSAWRMLGAEGKSDNIIEHCAKVPQARFCRVLEVGAGEGAILKCLDRKGFAKELHALEISASGVEVIRNQGIKTLASCQVFDGYSIPFDDNAFDLVILAHVLEHVEFPRVLLRELRRVSTYQYIEVPLDNPVERMESTLMLSYGHVDCFSSFRLRHLLISEGLLPIVEAVKKYQCSVMEYIHFEINGTIRTPEAVEAFRRDYAMRIENFNKMSVIDKDRNADICCMLTRQEKSYERESRLFSCAAKYIQLGRFGDANLVAEDLFRTARNARIFYELGRLCAASKRPNQARSMLEKALAMDASFRRAQDLLATLPAAGES